MKIVRISVHQADVPITPKTISHDRVVSEFDETLVRIETDTGIEGWGESVPWGANFVAAFAGGVRAGLEELAPHLLGQDPRMVGKINQLMDYEMVGQAYIKSPLDMACWDILGRSMNTPLYMLLGGMLTQEPKIIGSLTSEVDEKTREEIKRLRANGITMFSSKAHSDPGDNIEFLRQLNELMRPGETLKLDGNGGWRVDEALQVVKGMGNIDVKFEQPCATYEECREVRRTTGVPLILDESAVGIHDVLRAREDGVLDGLNLKIARVGGISKMRIIRDLCIALNVPMDIQDCSYSELACTVTAHFGHSTPERCLTSVLVPKGLKRTTVAGAPVVNNCRVKVHDEPGIGAKPILDVIGAPIAVYE